MTTQYQTLEFHKDGSLISQAVLDSDKSYLSIISHAPETNASWLVNHLIENGLQGTSSLGHDLKRIPNRSKVYFISFMHPVEFYITNCKKNGLDLSNNANFEYFDFFTSLFDKIKDPENATNEVEALFSEIETKIKSEKALAFVEAPEFLLASTNISSNFLLTQIAKIQKLAKETIIITSPTVSYEINNIEDPVFKITDFLVKLHHRSFLNLSLTPLSTGRANDITGCLTVAKGAIPFEVSEKEYIYLVTKEGNIKLSFR